MIMENSSFISVRNRSRSDTVSQFSKEDSLSGLRSYDKVPPIANSSLSITDMCSLCASKGVGEKATHICRDCSKYGRYLCQTCWDYHNRFLPTHDTLSLSDSSDSDHDGSVKPAASKSDDDIRMWLNELKQQIEKDEYNPVAFEKNPYVNRESEIISVILKETCNIMINRSKSQRDMLSKLDTLYSKLQKACDDLLGGDLSGCTPSLEVPRSAVRKLKSMEETKLSNAIDNVEKLIKKVWTKRDLETNNIKRRAQKQKHEKKTQKVVQRAEQQWISKFSEVIHWLKKLVKQIDDSKFDEKDFTKAKILEGSLEEVYKCNDIILDCCRKLKNENDSKMRTKDLAFKVEEKAHTMYLELTCSKQLYTDNPQTTIDLLKSSLAILQSCLSETKESITEINTIEGVLSIQSNSTSSISKRCALVKEKAKELVEINEQTKGLLDQSVKTLLASYTQLLGEPYHFNEPKRIEKPVTGRLPDRLLHIANVLHVCIENNKDSFQQRFVSRERLNEDREQLHGQAKQFEADNDNVDNRLIKKASTKREINDTKKRANKQEAVQRTEEQWITKFSDVIDWLNKLLKQIDDSKYDEKDFIKSKTLEGSHEEVYKCNDIILDCCRKLKNKNDIKRRITKHVFKMEEKCNVILLDLSGRHHSNSGEQRSLVDTCKSMRKMLERLFIKFTTVKKIHKRFKNFSSCKDETNTVVEIFTMLEKDLKIDRKSGSVSKRCIAIKKTVEKLSKVAGARLTDNNPNIADLNDPNRPTKIAEQYSELYDTPWTDAFETLENKDQENTDMLLKIIVNCYDICGNISKNHQRNLKNAVCYPADNIENGQASKQKRGTKENPISFSAVQSKALSELRKQTADISVDDVISQIESAQKDWFGPKKLRSYTTRCIELCWLMHVQTPPVVIDTCAKSGSKFDTSRYKQYTKAGKKIDFVVWPVLLLEEGGAVLCKGVAQGK